MDRVSTTSVLKDMAETGSYILREPIAGFMITLVDGIDGTVKADLTGRSDIIDDLLATRYIARSKEKGPSVGAEIYRVTNDGKNAR